MAQPALSSIDVSLPTAAGVATYPAGATFGPRHLRDFEFVWIIEGDCLYTHNAASHPAPPGSIVLCRPEATDAFRWDQRRRTRHAYFHFHVHHAPEAWGPPETWPLVINPPDGDILRPMFRHLLTWTDRGDALTTRLTIAHMLGAFVTAQASASEVPPTQLPEAVDRATALIAHRLEADPAAPIHLAELARAAAVSPEHLCRLFRSATGRTPVQTVRLARLDRAAVLVARSNYSFGQIAELCGFASAFHFSRLFRQTFGRSPRQVRSELAAGQAPPAPRLLWVPPALPPSRK